MANSPSEPMNLTKNFWVLQVSQYWFFSRSYVPLPVSIFFTQLSLILKVSIANFQVASSLTIKMRPGAQTFIWKEFNLHVNDISVWKDWLLPLQNPIQNPCLFIPVSRHSSKWQQTLLKLFLCFHLQWAETQKETPFALESCFNQSTSHHCSSQYIHWMNYTAIFQCSLNIQLYFETTLFFCNDTGIRTPLTQQYSQGRLQEQFS